MDLQLTGKKALVTGAGRGIGLATVRALEAEGVHVAAVARTITRELRGTGAITIAADLSDPAVPARTVTDSVRRLGGLDILINNVGSSGDDVTPNGFTDFDDAAWHQAFELNLFSAVRTSRAALPALLDGGGSIVNVSSATAKTPSCGPIPYAAAKAALTVVGKGMSEEFGAQGVRVATVSPGPVRTAMWAGKKGHGARLAEAMGMSHQAMLEKLPGQLGMTTNRFVEVDEVATLITYLSSPLATSITGDHLIDGGIVKSV